MKPDLARLIALESFRSSTMLGNLIPLIKLHLADEEYVSMSAALARCSAQIDLEVLEPLFSQHPDLKRELDERISTYGRAF